MWGIILFQRIAYFVENCKLILYRRGFGENKENGPDALHPAQACLRCVLRRVEILKMFAANLEYIFIISIFPGSLLISYVRIMKNSRIISE